MEIKKRKIEHWQLIAIGLVFFDIVAILASFFVALMFRFDFTFANIPGEYWHEFSVTIPIYIGVCVILYWIFGLYHVIWRFISTKEVIKLLCVCVLDVVIYFAGSLLAMGKMPISFFIIGIIFQFMLTGGIRCSYRVYLSYRKIITDKNAASRDNTMIIGAGEAGREVLASIRNQEEATENVICFIDDNPNKWKRVIDGVRVMGGRKSIPNIVKEYSIKKIYLCTPSATSAQKKDILEICKDTKCELKILPSIYHLASAEASVSQMKPVAVEDLLGREPIKVELDEILKELEGKTILVTGRAIMS